MTALLEISRPLACLAAASTSLLGSHLSRGAGLDKVAIGAATTVLLMVAACNIVNDISDVTADAVNRPRRPLPSGRVTVGGARLGAGLAAAGGLAVARLIGPSTLGVATLFLLAGIAYSVLVKRLGLVGHGWVAAMFGATVVWGGWVVGAISPPVWLAGLLVAAFLLPRELLKTLADVDGDRVAGWRTAALAWGRKTTMNAIVLAAVGFAAVTTIPVMMGVGGMVYLAGIWVGAVVPLAAITWWLRFEVESRLRRAELFTSLLWLPGVAALWQLG
ncbi:MAG TPA: UbiA family prenyltransferase [Acidimicrobiia bacterium]|nr:UbiA family prenyltransferase [Acidimicrobiia bacterium]